MLGAEVKPAPRFDVMGRAWLGSCCIAVPPRIAVPGTKLFIAVPGGPIMAAREAGSAGKQDRSSARWCCAFCRPCLRLTGAWRRSICP